MTTVRFRRPPRRLGTPAPMGEIALEAPPALAPPGNRWPRALVALPMASGTVAMAIMLGSRSGPLAYVTAALFGVSMLGIMATTLINAPRGSGDVDAERGDYLRYLSQVRRRARRAVSQQRAASTYLHPDPATLWSIVASQRRWERRPTDADFGVARIGLGSQAIAISLMTPATRPVDDLEPVSAAALRRFIRAFAVVPRLPVALSITDFVWVRLQGEHELEVDLARAILAQLAVFHAPDDLRIAVVTTPARRADWEWVKWLPHALDEQRTDGAGALRLLFESATEFHQFFAEEFDRRPLFNPAASRPAFDRYQLVVVLDGAVLPAHGPLADGLEGVTVLDLGGAVPLRTSGRIHLTLRLTAGAIEAVTKDSTTEVGRPDRMPLAVAEGLARQLAPYRLASPTRPPDPAAGSHLLSMLGIESPEQITPARWLTRPPQERLRIPIGLDQDGAAVELDLKESAQDGMGPHGLVVGATGSGKSELLRTIVTALALTHGPDEINFLFVDYRGGTAFEQFGRLPHTAALATGLGDGTDLIDRLRTVIIGELVRRQEMLRVPGYPTQREYERSRLAGAPLAELPTLLIICDEFTELLTAVPDFVEVLVQIGRLGRSLGVHLLLSTQRLEEGRLRGLDTHLSYRIALRTFSALESRIVLGMPDAYELPRAPGHGYLKSDSDPPRRFKGAYVSELIRRRAPAPAPQVVHYTSGYVPAPVSFSEPEDAEAREVSLLDTVVERLQGHGTPARRLWLPLLDPAPTLEELLASVPDSGPQSRLAVPAGIVDRPFAQRQDPLIVDLSGPDGNLLVVGRAGAGKSALLRTVTEALTLTNSPDQVQFAVLDLNGHPLSSTPHASPTESLTAALSLIDSREGRWEAGAGDLFLVVHLSPGDRAPNALVSIAMRGPRAGVHLLISADRWETVGLPLQLACGTRLELRLDDPATSEVDRRLAASVPWTPGRGLTMDKLHFRSARPPGPGAADPGTTYPSVIDLVTRRQATTEK